MTEKAMTFPDLRSGPKKLLATKDGIKVYLFLGPQKALRS